MTKFIKVALKKTMLKVAIDGQEKWATCTPQVLGYAKNTFKGGEEVDVQSDASGEVGLHVTRISKAGQGGGTTSTQPTPEFACADCGIELKDATYEKCWACNKKNPVKSRTKSSNGNFRTPEQLRRDEIGHMVSRTLIALTGQVDRNSVTEVMTVLYKKYQELVG